MRYLRTVAVQAGSALLPRQGGAVVVRHASTASSMVSSSSRFAAPPREARPGCSKATTAASRQLHTSRATSNVPSQSSSPKPAAAVTMPAPSDGPKAMYDARVAKGLLSEDSHQRTIVEGTLQKLHDELKTYKQRIQPDPEPPKRSLISKLFDNDRVPEVLRLFVPAAAPPEAERLEMPANVPKGLYLFGDVGCGKSMLMDLFYETLPSNVHSKRRVHFHQFMIDAHKRMHAFKALTHRPSGMAMSAASSLMDHVGGDGASRKAKEALDDDAPKMDAAFVEAAKKAAKVAKELGEEVDPIPHVAKEFAQEASVLCFDEFQVTDIADAMILRRLMEHMLWHGTVCVMTSNRHPKDLYKNGIQRSAFLPCIELLQSQHHVIDLDSGTDYRKRPRALSQVYFSPLDERTRREMDKLWEAATSANPHDPPMQGRKLDIWGRKLVVPQSTTRVARFDFMDLCGSPKSAADYIEVCRQFGTLFIDDIPRMGIHQRDLARRFITLVDACYESKTKVFMSSERPILQIFSSADEKPSIEQLRLLMDDLGLTMDDIGGSPIFTGDEELFAFARVISRLTEMGTKQYAQQSSPQEAPPEY